MAEGRGQVRYGSFRLHCGGPGESFGPLGLVGVRGVAFPGGLCLGEAEAGPWGVMAAPPGAKAVRVSG